MANKITRIQGGTLRTARAQDATVGMNLQTYNGEYVQTRMSCLNCGRINE